MLTEKKSNSQPLNEAISLDFIIPIPKMDEIS